MHHRIPDDDAVTLGLGVGEGGGEEGERERESAIDVLPAALGADFGRVEGTLNNVAVTVTAAAVAVIVSIMATFVIAIIFL